MNSIKDAEQKKAGNYFLADAGKLDKEDEDEDAKFAAEADGGKGKGGKGGGKGGKKGKSHVCRRRKMDGSSLNHTWQGFPDQIRKRT